MCALVAHVEFNLSQVIEARAFDETQVADVSAVHADGGQQLAEITGPVSDVTAKIFYESVGRLLV
jgi:hypothetical protein